MVLGPICSSRSRARPPLTSRRRTSTLMNMANIIFSSPICLMEFHADRQPHAISLGKGRRTSSIPSTEEIIANTFDSYGNKFVTVRSHEVLLRAI